MKNNTNAKYTPEEVLQILVDFYHFQADFVLEADQGEELTFQTTIKEWRSTCDLLEPPKLAKYYKELFGLETNESDIINVLGDGKEHTLKAFCDYIAQNAIREKINPIMSLGADCQDAAIFKTLKSKLEKKGIDTKDLKPSTEFVPFFDKHTSELVEIVSKLAPGSLTHYEIRDNIIGRLGAFTLLASIIALIVAFIVNKATWYLLAPFGVAILLFLIGNKMKPAKYEIGGYKTVRDLIIGMKSKIQA